jgi:hypothetical protein
VKIYVAAGEALRKKKEGVKLRKPSNGFLGFTPALNANVFFCRLFFNLTLCMTKLRVLVLSFPDFAHISIVPKLPHLHNVFQQICQNMAGFFSQNLLSSLTCSRIWLIPLVDDRHWGYITKLKNKTMEMISTIWTLIQFSKIIVFSLDGFQIPSNETYKL